MAIAPRLPSAHARGAPQVRVGLARALDHRPVRGHQLDRLDLAGDVAEALSRAVCRGRDRTGDRLHVDVAEVLEREPLAASASLRSRITIPPSTFARPAPRSTSSTRFIRSSRIIMPSVQAMSVNEWPEAAARTVLARVGGAADRAAQLLDRPGPLHGRRHALLVAGPVTPHRQSYGEAAPHARRTSSGQRDDFDIMRHVVIG